MKNIGGVLFFFGILSIVMNFFNAVPRPMAWIYDWGENIAWIIKISFVVVGFILTRLGGEETEFEEE